MQLQIDKLGKVSITIEESYWDINKDYDKLTVVEKEGTFGTYISRKIVPAGTMLTDRTYWIPFSSLKEDIVLDYNAFTSKYGEELNLVKEHISEIDEQIEILNKLNENTNEAIATANKAIDVATTAINAAKDALSEAENIIDTNKKYTEKLDKIGDNVNIGSSSSIGSRIFIGSNAAIGQNSVIEQNVFVGQNSTVEENVNIGTNVNIMENTNIASKTYIDNRGLYIGTYDEQCHIIGRDTNGNVFIGSDYGGVNLQFTKNIYYPIDISHIDNKNTSIKINKDANVVLGSDTHVSLGDAYSVSIGSGVNVDPDINITNGNNYTIEISKSGVNSSILGENSKLGANVKLDISNKALTYQVDKTYTVATTDDVDKRINDIVAGAPEAFDTLKEISDKLKDNDDVVAGIITTLGDKANKSELSNIIGRTITVSTKTNDDIEIIKDSNVVYPITKFANLINNDGSYVKIGTKNININGSFNVSSDVFIEKPITIKGYINLGTQFYTHDNGNIYEGFSIGNTSIGSNVLIGSGTCIEQGIFISTSLYSDASGYTIGTGNDFTNIGTNVTIGNKVKIAKNTQLLNSVYISNTYIGQANIVNANIGDSVTINNNVTIGNNININDGAFICKASYIGTNVKIQGETYIGGVLTIADKGALSIATQDGQAATYIGTNVSIGDNIGIGNTVYINDGVSIQKNIKLINILASDGNNEIQGLRIKNDKAIFNYELGTGFYISRRDNNNCIVNIEEGFNVKQNVTLGSGVKLEQDAYIGTGIKFDVKNGNLVVTVNDKTYGITLNTLS